MQNCKTGIIYDSRMLRHKSKRKHPERPQRAKGIISRLTELGILENPRVQFVPSVSREIGEFELELAHKKKYIKHIADLWPKTSHRTDITVLDTYFNEHSESCAKIAVGGVLESIDKIMANEWENAFAAVRPPGHHSGGRNTINGFCVFNNVAIGARYLAERYNIKKVAIIDWDVHHGDGTQAIFQADPNILFISLHRYDRGTFYPASEDGHVTSQGIDNAKGLNVNICLDFVDQKFKQYKFQSPGDNEYSYIFHRIVEPILRAYDPDFILVSSGFDAAFGDPLGGFTITPNGYFYLTKKIMELKKKMLVVLEGGYNVNAISVSAEAVIRALIHQEDFPEPISIPEEKIKDLCQLHPILHAQVDYIIEVLSENWKILKNPLLLEYSQMIKNNKERVFGQVQAQSSSSSSEQQQNQSEEGLEQEDAQKKQKGASKSKDKKKSKSKGKQQATAQANIKPKSGFEESSEDETDSSVTNQFYFAAGHMQRFKNFSPDNPKLFKLAPDEEINFYENLTFQRQFTSKYYGKEGNYIVLQNLLYQQTDPVVIDLKISRQSQNPTLDPARQEKEKKKEMASTSDKYGFRVSGYTTPLYKEGGLLAKTEETVNKILKNAVTLQNQQLFVTFLQKLAEALKTSKRRYFGTSIVLIKGPIKSEIRWVDFHYWMQTNEGFDANMLEGINNLTKFIKELDFAQ